MIKFRLKKLFKDLFMILNDNFIQKKNVLKKLGQQQKKKYNNN